MEMKQRIFWKLFGFNSPSLVFTKTITWQPMWVAEEKKYFCEICHVVIPHYWMDRDFYVNHFMQPSHRQCVRCWEVIPTLREKLYHAVFCW